MTEFARRIDDAARHACTAYLNGTGAWGPARRAQEYDQLSEAGKTVWRVVVRRAADDLYGAADWPRPTDKA